jgi:hypothetical protein
MYAREEGYQYCAHLDSDGQHPATELQGLLEEVWSGRADIAVGSRFTKDGEPVAGDYEPTLTRRIGIAVFRFVVSRATGQRFTDTTSGIRAADRAAIEMFAGRYSPDFAEVESLQRAVRAGLRVVEKPVRVLPREEGASFLTPLKAAFFVFKGVIVLLVRPRES